MPTDFTPVNGKAVLRRTFDFARWKIDNSAVK
jgi:hypothetical protein